MSTEHSTEEVSVSRRSVLGKAATVGAVGVAGAGGAAGGVLIDDSNQATASADDQSRYERGRRMLRQISGQAGLDVIDSLGETAPDLARYIVEFTYGDIYPRPHLGLPERQLVTLGALVAAGDTAPQQNVHVNAALNVGLTPQQIIEALLQCAPYAGFPRVLNAITVAREVFADRDIDLPDTN